MTLIALYHKKPKFKGDSEGLTCLADSLISPTDNSRNTITEQAMKIFSLDFKYNIEEPEYKKLIPCDIGMAYAGNPSIALQTYNLVRICCRNLMPLKNNNIPPSVQSVSILTAQILYHYYKNYGFLWGEHAQTNILIFGFCFKTLRYEAYYISPKIENDNIVCIPENINIDKIPYFSFGSGAKDFDEFHKNNNYLPMIYSFKEFLKTETSRNLGVGGYIQRCFLNLGCLRYYADLSIDEQGINPLNMQLSGFNFSNCHLDDFLVSFGASLSVE